MYSHPLTSQQYYEQFAPKPADLFRSAKIRAQQLNPHWNESKLNQFGFDVLWLTGKCDASRASEILRWNYQRLAHMRNSANTATALSRTPALTPVGQWGFDAAVEFAFSHFEHRLP